MKILCPLLLAALLAACGSQSAADTDRDGMPDSDDPRPLVSDFPLVIFRFSTPVIGIRYKVSGSSIETQTLSTTAAGTSTSDAIDSTQRDRKDTKSNQFNDTKNSSLDVSGALSDIPKVDIGFASKGTSEDASGFSDSFSSSSSLSNRQQQAKDRKELVDRISKRDTSFDPDSGYAQSTLTIANYSTTDVSLRDISISMQYANQSSETELFLSGAKLRAVSGATGSPESKALPQDQDVDISLAGRPGPWVARRSVQFNGLSSDSIMKLARASGVELSLEDYHIKWANEDENLTSYARKLAEKRNQLVTVRISGPHVDEMYLAAPKDQAKRAISLNNLLSLGLGYKINLTQFQGRIYARSIGKTATYFGPSHQPKTGRFSRINGRWLVKVNDESTFNLNTLVLKAGDQVSVTYLPNDAFISYGFRKSEFNGEVSVSDAFRSAISANGTLVASEKLRSDGMRTCLPITVGPGDVLAVEFRYSESRNSTIQQPILEGRYPADVGDRGTPLSFCRAKQFVPSSELEMLRGDDALFSNSLFISLGEDGPEISVADLVAGIPSDQTRALSDGTVQFYVGLDKSWLSEPRNVCLGLKDLQGTGPLGRSIRQDFAVGGGIMQAAINDTIRTHCQRWRDGDPEVAIRSFPRSAKALISVSVFTRMEPKQSKKS